MVHRSKLLLSLAGVTLAGCGLGADDGFPFLRITDNFRAVELGRAYRSAQLDGTTFALLSDMYGINTVINLRGENADARWYQDEKAALDEKGVELVDVRWSATKLPARAELLELYDTFLTAEEPILIHCQAGADRTGAASAIWRMMMLGEDREMAADQLRLMYGHLQPVTPAMDELVRIFQPDRAWIENDYPVP